MYKIAFLIKFDVGQNIFEAERSNTHSFRAPWRQKVNKCSRLPSLLALITASSHLRRRSSSAGACCLRLGYWSVAKMPTSGGIGKEGFVLPADPQPHLVTGHWDPDVTFCYALNPACRMQEAGGDAAPAAAAGITWRPLLLLLLLLRSSWWGCWKASFNNYVLQPCPS